LRLADCGFTSLAHEQIVGRLGQSRNHSGFTETPYNVS
jgi:hypothetical protein